jgi:hypothetical protein
MGSACNLTAAKLYAPKHVPFLYYANVQGDAARCTSRVVDFGASFFGDLAAPPVFSFIAPNLVDDMHNITSDDYIANGDAWLSAVASSILASDAYRAGGALVVVWDEDDFSGIAAPDDPIPLVVLSPYAKAGFVSSGHGDHYSLLATIEDALMLPRLGQAQAAQPLAELFAAQ